MRKFIKLQEWFVDLDSIKAISKVVEIDVNQFGGAYGFEIVVNGETLPIVFADKNEAIFYRDEILKLLLINSQVIDLDKLKTKRSSNG